MSEFIFTGSMISSLSDAEQVLTDNITVPNAGSVVYNDILQDISQTGVIGSADGDPIDGDVPAPNVMPASWDWIDGAIGVNENTGFAGQFIVDYTIDQYELRSGQVYTTEQFAVASNQLALSVVKQIVQTGTLPTISQIGTEDAAEAAGQIFQAIYSGIQDVAGWAGTLLFPFLGAPSFFDEYLLSTQAITGSLAKINPGLYDLTAALAAQQSASVQVFTSNNIISDTANVAQAIENEYDPLYSNVPGYQSAIEGVISATNATFYTYYNLPADNEFMPGDDLAFNGISALVPNNTYFAGYSTLADDIKSTENFTSNAVIVGGSGNNTIVAPMAGDDLIDGGIGGMNTLDLSSVGGPLTIQMGSDMNESELKITGSEIETNGDDDDVVPTNRTIYAYNFAEVTLDSVAAATFVTEGGETIGLNLTLASSPQNPILQFSSGTSKTFTASTSNEVLVVSGISDTLTADSSYVTLIDLNGGTVDFSGGNYSNLTEIGPQGSSTSGFSITSGSETFNYGSGTNVLIGGSGTNTFDMAAGVSAGTNIIWGDDGTSTYEIYGTIDIVNIASPTSVQQVQNYSTEISTLPSSSLTTLLDSTGPTTYIIDPSSSDVFVAPSADSDPIENTIDSIDLINSQPSLQTTISLSTTGSNGFNVTLTTGTGLETDPTSLSISTEGLSTVVLGAGAETLDATQVLQGLTFIPEGLNKPGITQDYGSGNTIIGNISAPDVIDLGGGLLGPPSMFSGEVLIEYFELAIDYGNATVAGQFDYDLGNSADDGLITSGYVSVTDVSTIFAGDSVSTAVLDEGSVILETENGVITEDGTQYTVSIDGMHTTIGYGTDIASLYDADGQVATITGAESLVLSGFTTIEIQNEFGLNGVGAPFFDGTPSGPVDQQGNNQSVGSAASESGENVNDAGVLSVAGGGTTDSLMISGGTEYVSRGGVDSDSEITGGGSQTILNGGTVYYANIIGPDTDFSGLSGGIYSSKAISQSFQIVQSGGTAISTFDDGEQVINAGGTSIDTLLSQSETIDNPEDATEVISSGGIAVNTDAIANGGLTVVSGGIVTGGTVANNSEAFISGGTALNLDFENFGVLYVYSNGIVNNAVIDNSEVYDLGGTIKNALFSGFGAYAQISQGLILSASIIAGGVDVIIGGSASASMIASGSQEFVEFGSSFDPTVGLGGEEYLDVSASSISATIKKGGIEYVDSADTAISTTVSNGGYLIISAGATALSPTILSGGEIIVVNGATIENLNLASGAQYISAGSAFDGSISILSSSFVGSGTITSANVGYDEVEYVLSGGTVSGAILGPASSQIVYSGGTVISNTVNGGDTLSEPEQTLSGGVSIDTMVDEGAQVVVGGTAYASEIDGAYQAVSEMGYASGTILTSGNGVNGGVQSVLSGGTVIGTIVDLSTDEDVDSGGVAYSSFIAGVAEADTGGQLIDAIISSGGSVILDDGGFSSATTVLSGGVEEIGISYVSTEPDSITTSDTVNSGGTYTVLSAGSAYDLIGNSGARIIAYSGAHISDLYLATGASLLTLPGAVINFSADSPSTSQVEASILVETNSSSFTYGNIVSGLVLDDGEEYIYSGGTAIATELAEGGQIVSDGGTAISDRGYGYVYVYSGGSVVNSDLSAGSQEVVYTGGVDSGTILTDSGDNLNLSQEFLSGGIAYSDVIVSGAVQYIFAGAAIGTQNYSGGELAQYSGVISSGTVYSAGLEAIQYGGVDSASTIGLGGQQDILDGGTAFDVNVESGGGQYVDPAGQSICTTVQNGGYEVVASGGQSYETTVDSGGILIILAGGTASNFLQEQGGVVVDMPGATVSGIFAAGMNTTLVPGFLVAQPPTTSVSFLTMYGVDYPDAYAFFPTDPGSSLPADSTEYVLSGTQAYNVVLPPGAHQVVLPGAIVDGLVTSNSYEQIDGGSAQNISVGFGGILAIYAAGIATDSLIESYSYENIYGGGSSVSATIQYAAEEYVSAGSYSFDTTISSGGVAYIGSGARDYSATIFKGGEQIVSSGGSAYNSIIDGGSEVVSFGGVVQSTFIQSNGAQTILSGADAYNVVIGSGGTEFVSDGTLYNATVESGGLIIVSSGAEAVDSLISGGGTQYVLAGGSAQSSILIDGGDQIVQLGAHIEGTIIGYGSTETVLSGSTAADIVVSGGIQIIYSGGVASGTILENCGTEIVLAGGTAQSSILNGGTEIVLPGGQINYNQVNSGASQILYSGAAAFNILVGGGNEYVSGGTVQNLIAGKNSLLDVTSGSSIYNLTLMSGSTTSFSYDISLSGPIIFNGSDIEVDTPTTLRDVKDLVLPLISGFDSQSVSENDRFVIRTSGIDVLNSATFNPLSDILTIYMRNLDYASKASYVLSFSAPPPGQLVVSIDPLGDLVVSASGDVIGAMVTSTITTGASAIDVVASGGTLYVQSGGLADAALVYAEGTELVQPGGTVSGTVLYGGGIEIVKSGGTASTSFIDNNGSEVVCSSASVFDTSIGFGGYQFVASGGTISGTVIAGGSLILNGTAYDVSNFGFEQIDSNGKVVDDMVVGGQEVISGGYEYSGTISDGGSISAVGGTTLFDNVGSGGFLSVINSGSALFTTVISGGSLFIDSGGRGYYNSIGPQGTDFIALNGLDSASFLYDGAMVVAGGGSAFGETVGSGGIQIVSGAGAYSVNTNILAGGTEIVAAGGTAIDTYDGGLLIIQGGGSADDVILGASINDPSKANSQATVAAAGTSYSTHMSPAFMTGSVQATGSLTSAQVVFLQMTSDGIATVTGAGAVPTAFNIVSDMTAGGGSYTINDFIGSSSAIYLVNSAGTGPGDAVVSSITNVGGNALITLSDGTNITLTGLTTSTLKVDMGANGITSIT